ncbi:uncharacterized protein LOC142656544 [Rhinoderma darwinii]|uniref:uncharacterized protein LOC142656544 n=1 Tax=Rhinoderma darwinii TaxID=43563 RepID=UPI003F66C6D6
MAVSGSFFYYGLIFLLNAVTLVRSTKKSTFLLVNGNESVTARLGEDVILPCTFKINGTVEMSKLSVHWSKDGETKYFSNKTCCDFLGHDISEDDFENGSAPLQLVNVQEKDYGMYTCSIKYEKMEGNWTTQFHIPEIQVDHGIQTTAVAAAVAAATTVAPAAITVAPGTGDSVVPKSMPQYRVLKIGLVSGALALTALLAVFVYFCFEG